MKKFIHKILLAVLILLLHNRTMAQTRVYLIPVLHGLHQSNASYSYDSLKQIIRFLEPGIIAVEIRPEDMNSDTSYLKKNYPYEMWMMQTWFPHKTVVGFDWLGADLEGNAIPENYWQTRSEIKKLQTRLNLDSVMTERLRECSEIITQRMVTLRTATLKALLEGNDALLVRKYYDCLERNFSGTEYEALTGFYDLRNRKMMERISVIINDNPHKTIVFITGADHYPYLYDYLSALGIDLLHPYHADEKK